MNGLTKRNSITFVRLSLPDPGPDHLGFIPLEKHILSMNGDGNYNPFEDSQPALHYPDLIQTSNKTPVPVDYDHHQPPPPEPDQTKHPKGDHDGSEIDDKWGTQVMGTPAVPTCHPNNHKAALWGPAPGDQYEYQYHHYPYLHYTPLHDHQQTRSCSVGPTESVLHKFNSWTRKAEATANNIWHNLKTGPSVPGAAWAKVNLRAKAITGGGFESLYKQTFTTSPNEKLKKTFACYLSTSTGPVAGTLYLSNLHIAFCSDRPLSFTAPSGQQTWSYYKVLIPLGNVGTLNPVIMTENPTERYIQVVTVDGQDFWFMGFVNYEKATCHLFESTSSFAVSGIPVKQPPAVAA